MDFLPTTKQELESKNIDTVDFVLVTGDAYVDHPSFGAAIIGRLLESRGYSVAVLPQPDWKTDTDFTKFGKPRLGFLVTSGNVDSMVNHYSVAKKKRDKDSFSPGGKTGLRPDRACIVYSQMIRKVYGKGMPIILGGLEASLRRLGHYDYWDNKVRASILLDSGADLICYGMAERAIPEVADSLASGLPVNEITFVNGTVFSIKDISRVVDPIFLPCFKKITSDKREYAGSFMLQYENTDYLTARPLIEQYSDRYVVQNIPSIPLTQQELDSTYSLGFMRDYHPMYTHLGGVPAITEVKFSITANRGCFGSCNFCALTFHQGRVVQTRSHASILAEAKMMTFDTDFKGYIHDVGGPTANFHHRSCEKQIGDGICKRKRCMFPVPCKNLDAGHDDYLELLRKLRRQEGIKKVFIRSGIRFDYLLLDKNKVFFNDLCKYHISGQLKVAPEHVSNRVLKHMGKPSVSTYNDFAGQFSKINERLGLKQYLVPYLMSSHPGSELKDAVELAEYLHKNKISPQQVQDFYPTPGTYSTCMYYTGLDPQTMEPVYVPASPHEKAMQRALIQYRLPQNYKLVCEALKLANREDLIGFGKECIIRPRNIAGLNKQRAAAGSEKPKKSVKKKKTIRNIHPKKGKTVKRGG